MGLCKDGYWRESERYEGKKYVGCAGRKDKKGNLRTDKEMQSAALKDLAEKIAAAKAGTSVLNNNTTVKKWSETWLETYVKHTDITDKTYRNIKGKVNRNIVDLIGSMRLKDVKDVHLQELLNKHEGKSLSHVSKLRSYMKQMFGRAVKSKLIPFNPAEDLELPKAADRKHRKLTQAERAAFLQVAQTHRAGLWIKTMLYCGPRPGECIPLQWRDVDFKNCTLNIHQAKESGSNNIKGPKSDAGYRIVPVPDVLMNDFRANKGKPLDYLFTQAKSKKMHTESSLRCAWLNFLRNVDIALGAKVYRNQIVESKLADDLDPYDLRHTYGTDLAAAKVPPDMMKYLLGHEDVATSINYYTDPYDNIVKDAAELLNAFHSKTPVKNPVKTLKSKSS